MMMAVVNDSVIVVVIGSGERQWCMAVNGSVMIGSVMIGSVMMIGSGDDWQCDDVSVMMTVVNGNEWQCDDWQWCKAVVIMAVMNGNEWQ
jgi:hypothetical protein